MLFLYLQFFDLLSANPLPTQYLANELTVFAPVDSAFNETNYKGPKDENMILNHMGIIVFQTRFSHNSHNFPDCFVPRSQRHCQPWRKQHVQQRGHTNLVHAARYI